MQPARTPSLLLLNRQDSNLFVGVAVGWRTHWPAARCATAGFLHRRVSRLARTAVARRGHAAGLPSTGVPSAPGDRTMFETIEYDQMQPAKAWIAS
jgi:hypothetical protein